MFSFPSNSKSRRSRYLFLFLWIAILCVWLLGKYIMPVENERKFQWVFFLIFWPPLFSAFSNQTEPNLELGFYKHHFSSLNRFLRRFDSPVLSGPFPFESFAYFFPLFLVYICRCGKMYPDLGSSEKANTAATIITGVAPVKMYLQIKK